MAELTLGQIAARGGWGVKAGWRLGRVILGDRVPRKNGKPLPVASLRLREVEKLILHRCGGMADTDDASLIGDVAAHLVPPAKRREWLMKWCPGMSASEIEQALDAASFAPQRLSAVEAGDRLFLSETERDALGIRTMKARVPRRHDQPRPLTETEIIAKAKAERVEKAKARMSKLRAARKAAAPSSEKVTAADEAKRLGVSRATLYRRRAAKRETEGRSQ